MSRTISGDEFGQMTTVYHAIFTSFSPNTKQNGLPDDRLHNYCVLFEMPDNAQRTFLKSLTISWSLKSNKIQVKVFISLQSFEISLNMSIKYKVSLTWNKIH